MRSVLVAGAGPAGSTVALLLARAHASVRIFERSAFPRTKACGEYLSPRTVRLLNELGIGAQLARRARTVEGVRLHGHGVHARITFPFPGWSLPRSVLDQVLLEAALGQGATLTQAHVEGCTDTAHCARVAVRFPDGSVESLETSALVAADGMHSIVARKCGFARPARKAQARFALGGHYCGFARLDGFIDMFVDGGSYLAINPLSDETANVMLVVDAGELEAHRDDVDAFAEERARMLGGDLDRKSTRLNSSHVRISYAVFCLTKKKRRPRIPVGATEITAECTRGARLSLKSSRPGARTVSLRRGRRSFFF